MGSRTRPRFKWWTVPVGVALWAVGVWAAGLVRVWGGDAGGQAAFVRVRLPLGAAPVAAALVAALALVVFADHLRRARGSSGGGPAAS